MKIALVWPLLVALPLFAQNDLQANVNLQFRFANPGARAQAMGGAFVGLADDTTALFANPAGLTQMGFSTFVMEGNQLSNNHNIPFYSGSIDQVDLQDFDFQLQDKDFKNDNTSIPFVGYVSPKKRVKWGVFLAEQGNFERSFETLGVGIPFYRGGRYVDSFDLELFPPSSNFTQIQMRTAGFTIAGKLSNVISAGVTLAYNQMDYTAGSVFRFPNYEELFPDVSFSPSQIAVLRQFYGLDFGSVDVEGKDEQVGIYAGILLTPNERFSVGLAIKQQPEFDYDYTIRSRDSSFEWEEPVLGTGVFNVPDSYSIGLSFKPSDVAVLSLEVNRVTYSELSDDFTRFFNIDEDPIMAQQEAADITEYHAGFEYVFVDLAFPLALRMGYYFEPYHALQNTVLDTQLLFRFINQVDDFEQGSRNSAFLQRFAQDLNHATFGLGWSFGNFVVDLSVDLDEENSSYSLSSIYRFQ